MLPCYKSDSVGPLLTDRMCSTEQVPLVWGNEKQVAAHLQDFDLLWDTEKKEVEGEEADTWHTSRKSKG